MEQNNKRVRTACYSASVNMAIVGCLSPLLFLTFRDIFGLSYSLLGFLIVINFFTQLAIDLIFSFFSHKFNVQLTVRLMPCITVVGLLIYAIMPILMPNLAFVWLAIGTVIFSCSAGLAEVLMSPIVAALPSDNPDRDMSKLHSFYAWGSVGVVVFSTLFLKFFTGKYWYVLTLILTLIPVFTIFAFAVAKIPEIKKPEKTSGAVAFLKNKQVWLVVIAIFFGGATECAMSQWASTYLEKALAIPKVWGDVLGVAMFAVMLGLGRTLYAKFGKNLERVLLLGAIASLVCYLVCGFTNIAVLGLIACALTGLTASMLWPGTLVVAEERVGNSVFIFAMLAAGGDLGAGLSPQLMGIVTDYVSQNFTGLADTLTITPENLGMKAGLLVGALFPLIAIILYSIIYKTKKER